MAKYVTVIGFPTKDINESEPVEVFLGKDPRGIDAAIAASPCKTFFVHQDGGAAKRITKEDPPAPKPLPTSKKSATKKSADDK